jgi:non-homologous end joining protein Ku
MPVKAYPATTSDGGGVKLNQLHVDCHSRINYKKTCPVHGEVSNDSIVSGYEYQKGQYAAHKCVEQVLIRQAQQGRAAHVPHQASEVARAHAL